MNTAPTGETASLLLQTYNLFASEEKDRSNVYVFACQHILRPREEMLSFLVRFGIPQKNIFILGKIYSTNPKLLHELLASGYSVVQPEFDYEKSFDDQHRSNCEWLFSLCKEKVPPGSRVIVLDDGGMLLSIFNSHYEELSHLEIVGIEQTSSGFRKLEHENLRFPIVNVARSVIKLTKESPHIAETCFAHITSYILRETLSPSSVFVIGLGPIGAELLRKFEAEGYRVEGFDRAYDNGDIVEKIMSFKPDIIIGATGSTCLSVDQIEQLTQLNQPMYFISVSSSDREFPASSFRDSSGHTVHDDVVYKNLIFVNNGFPINFGVNREKEGIETMGRTMCLLLGSILYLADLKKEALGNGFHDIPAELTNIL